MPENESGLSVTEAPDLEDVAMDDEERSRCIAITKMLMKDDNAWPFLKPVDPIRDGCPTYFDVIDSPMDLGTVLVGKGRTLHL